MTGPNKTSLLILNATTWDLIAKIDFSVETAIPKCLHGWYFPCNDNDKDTPTTNSSSKGGGGGGTKHFH